MKPWVKKYGSYWAWRCPLQACRSRGEMPGEEFGPSTRDPWCVALTRAQQHADQFHGEVAA